jgi:hypothetical protein
MAQYLIIFGGITPTYKRGKPSVAVRFDGMKATLTGSEPAVNHWSDLLVTSWAIARTVADDQVNISSFVNSNSMLDVIAYDESEQKKFQDIFSSVKGVSRTIELVGIPDKDDPKYDKKVVEAFRERKKKIMKSKRQNNG